MGALLVDVQSASSQVNGTSLSVPAPSPIADGNLLLGFFTSITNGDAGVLVLPPGFVTLFVSNIGNSHWIVGRRVASGESGPYLFDKTLGSSANGRIAALMLFSGNDPITPINIDGHQNTQDLSAPFDVIATNILTTALSLVVRWVGGSAGTPFSYSFLSGNPVTERLDRVESFAGLALYTDDNLVFGTAGTTVIRVVGSGTCNHGGGSIAINGVSDFQDQEEAEARAREKVADGTWVNAHSERTLLGASAVRFQRFMGPGNPGAGGWVETTDTVVT